MRRAEIHVHGVRAGLLEELEPGRSYRFSYDHGYEGPPVSLTMPVEPGGQLTFDGFPPFFDGLLPEGPQLDALLRLRKLDRDDLFGQLLAVGRDMVGAVTAWPTE
jgi:serine/threonine-protein kinase HipA